MIVNRYIYMRIFRIYIIQRYRISNRWISRGKMSHNRHDSPRICQFQKYRFKDKLTSYKLYSLYQFKNSYLSLSVFALIGYQLFHGSLRHKCVLKPQTEKSQDFSLWLLEWNVTENRYAYPVDSNVEQYLDDEYDYRGNYLVPDHHGQFNNELKMPPCDDSQAAQSTAKDKSSDSVLHNSIQFNQNLRGRLEPFIPTFSDSYTNQTSLSYSWCWKNKMCNNSGIVDLLQYNTV